MTDSADQGRRLPRPKKKAKKKGLPKPKALENTASDGEQQTVHESGASTGTWKKRRKAPSRQSTPSADRYAATMANDSNSSGASEVSRYDELRLIARGGMGEVWLAQDRKLRGRYVALKRLNEQSLNDPKLRQRFEAEAEAMAQLSHPHVINVLDIGAENNEPFICMEFISGPARKIPDWADHLPPPPMTLQEYVEEQAALPLAEAVRLIRALNSAVMEAHRLGIIHRDIKPANVLLDAQLSPRLIDFGLARDLTPELSQHTAAGAQMLTIGYGAPEQETDASDADERADVYALGAVLWFMVSGQNPRFYRNSDAPEELKAVLAAALMRDREARLQSVQEFDQAIAAVGSTVVAAPEPASVTEQTGPSAAQQLVEVADRLEGQKPPGFCPVCEHVHEPLPKSPKERQFCAGCGTGIWIKCGKCKGGAFSFRKSGIVPIWERYCSKCGDDLLSGMVSHLRDVVGFCENARRASAAERAQLAASAGVSVDSIGREYGDDYSRGRFSELCKSALTELNESASLGNQQEQFQAFQAEAPQYISGNRVLEGLEYLQGADASVQSKDECRNLRKVFDWMAKLQASITSLPPVPTKDDLTTRVRLCRKLREELQNLSQRGEGVELQKTCQAAVTKVDEVDKYVRGRIPPKRIRAPFNLETATEAQQTWSDYFNLPIVLEPGHGMKLALIPPGDFVMGSPPGEEHRRKLEGRRRVRIQRPFYIGVVPLSEQQKATIEQPSTVSLTRTFNSAGDETSAVNLSWDDCVKLVTRLNRANQMAGWQYNLPSEEQWEYACRAGTPGPFNCSPVQLNCKGYGPGRQIVPGGFVANQFGLFECHGDVWEWCRKSEHSVVDDDNFAPIRGGSFDSHFGECRSAARNVAKKSNRSDQIGFRLVLEPIGPDTEVEETE